MRFANKSREGNEPKDSPPDPCLCRAEGPSPSRVREASQLIFGVRPLPRSKDSKDVFEGVSSMGAPSPMSSMVYVSRRARASTGAGAGRRVSLGVALRCAGPRAGGGASLGPARAARSSPESLFDLALLDPRRLARGRATARAYRVD